MAAGRVSGALITRPPPLPWTAAIPLAGRQRLEAAGPADIRAVECGSSVHRRAEGYDEVIDNEDRIGAGYTAFDYHREIDGVTVKDLPRNGGADGPTAAELPPDRPRTGRIDN